MSKTLQYCVSAIGYDEDGNVTDYEYDFCDPTTLAKAREEFNKATQMSFEQIAELAGDKGEVDEWYIQLEKCEVTPELIECIDLVDDYSICKEA